MQKMYLLITITNRSDSDEFTKFFSSKEIPIIYSTPCLGTARQKTLDLFGIEASQKTVHYCIVTENKTYELIKALTKEMAIDLPNRGISVAIPLSSIAGRRTLEAFANGHLDDETENEVSNMAECETELIVVICAKGNTDLVMDAAREAGAGGGTVVHAKGTGSQYAGKFFGVTIADEKEMIYIVSTKERKKEIMRAVIEKAGPETDAHAIVFSLPVSATAGLRIFDK
ncbi:MAG: P-II family nitrogen regulator [Clostridia bacterium]|nr:P-II family nitrogen regulator [Clostridia bacterium]MBR2297092.1 P-II family nitrogen regulator [Clostridia bacterium]